MLPNVRNIPVASDTGDVFVLDFYFDWRAPICQEATRRRQGGDKEVTRRHIEAPAPRTIIARTSYPAKVVSAIRLRNGRPCRRDTKPALKPTLECIQGGVSVMLPNVRNIPVASDTGDVFVLDFYFDWRAPMCPGARGDKEATRR